MDISQKTWKYLHGPDDVAHLSFKTGAVPRSFSVLQYSAVEQDHIDLSEDGIAIIDNDYMSVVLDGCYKRSQLEQSAFMSSVRRMSWPEFSSFCTSHPRYRISDRDMHKATPDHGVVVNQIQRGVLTAPDDDDLRSPSMIAAHRDLACPYVFPASSKSEMIADILGHDCLKGDDGKWRISWDAFLNYHTILTNEDGEENVWSLHLAVNPEIVHDVINDILEPYFTGRIGTFPKTDDGRYGFVSGGINQPMQICLDLIDMEPFSFHSRGEFGRFIDQLTDTAVRDIWKLIRVLDHDLSQAVLHKEFDVRMIERQIEYEAQVSQHQTPHPPMG